MPESKARPQWIRGVFGKFKQKVIPGDTLVFELKLISPIRRGLVHMSGVGYVDGKSVVEAEMLAQVIKDKTE